MSDDVRIGIAGLGTVGCGVVEMLQTHRELLQKRTGKTLRITAVSARSAGKDRGVDLSEYRWIDDPVSMATDDEVDLVVELIGGSEGVAYDLVKGALQNGKHVVTANKALLAHHGVELASLAEEHGGSLSFEAAIAGCIPIVKAVRESLMGNEISSVYGILNGTCNYILSEMRVREMSFEDALAQAQDLGYAEADPSFDVDGVDTAHKISLLAAMAFGIEPTFQTLHTQGIRHVTALDISFAEELGYRIKLLGIAKMIRGRVSQSVEPCLVPKSSPLWAIEDVYNAVLVEADYAEMPFFSGLGAGQKPTASAVLGDIVDVARGNFVPAFGVRASDLKDAVVVTRGEAFAPYYIRLMVSDQAGVLSDISAILKDQDVSIEVITQRARASSGSVPVVLKAHAAPFANMNEALRLIGELEACIEAPCLIRIADEL